MLSIPGGGLLDLGVSVCHVCAEVLGDVFGGGSGVDELVGVGGDDSQGVAPVASCRPQVQGRRRLAIEIFDDF